MSDSTRQVSIYVDDVIDVLKLASAGLEDDSPHNSKTYLNGVVNTLTAYLTSVERKQVSDYIKDKGYKPAVQIQLAR